jgi:hypothetical protein
VTVALTRVSAAPVGGAGWEQRGALNCAERLVAGLSCGERLCVTYGSWCLCWSGARGVLFHTEEVTGSIPISPTQLRGQNPSMIWPLLPAVQRRSTAVSVSHRGSRPAA